jgi:hypothetical protein
MPDGRVSILIEGPYTVLDPENPDPFIEAAGSQFIRLDTFAAVVLTEGTEDAPGIAMPVYKGWAVVRPDGAGDGHYRFVAPEVLAGGLAGA